MPTRTDTERPPVPKGWATRAEVAEYTGYSVQTLANLKARGKGPPTCGKGRSLRYPWPGVERWMRERTT